MGSEMCIRDSGSSATRSCANANTIVERKPEYRVLHSMIFYESLDWMGSCGRLHGMRRACDELNTLDI